MQGNSFRFVGRCGHRLVRRSLLRGAVLGRHLKVPRGEGSYGPSPRAWGRIYGLVNAHCHLPPASHSLPTRVEQRGEDAMVLSWLVPAHTMHCATCLLGRSQASFAPAQPCSINCVIKRSADGGDRPPRTTRLQIERKPRQLSVLMRPPLRGYELEGEKWKQCHTDSLPIFNCLFRKNIVSRQ